MSAVLASIAACRARINDDEALFTADGRPLVADTSSSLAACDAAFGVMLAAPCRTIADVRAKVRFILDGTVGDREPLVHGLTGGDGDDINDPSGPLVTFLRSLLATPAGAA